MTDDIVGKLLSKPLEAKELATVFGVSVRRLSEVLDTLQGVQKVGRRFRVPLSQMPPEYWLEVGLLSANSDKLGQTRPPITLAISEHCELANIDHRRS